jgi:hypothetical protein
VVRCSFVDCTLLLIGRCYVVAFVDYRCSLFVALLLPDVRGAVGGVRCSLRQTFVCLCCCSLHYHFDCSVRFGCVCSLRFVYAAFIDLLPFVLFTLFHLRCIVVRCIRLSLRYRSFNCYWVHFV